MLGSVLIEIPGIFEDVDDGLIDLRKDTTFFTVSNNILRGQDKAFGIGKLEYFKHYPKPHPSDMAL